MRAAALTALVVAQLGLAGCAVTAAPPAVPAPVAPVAATTVSAPVAVRIPTLDVTSPLIRLGTDAAGVLVPPDAADVAGWYAAGPAPGEIGPAVVAGHVDSRSGPGVFLDLAELRPGDTVEIDRADGTVLEFVVRSVGTVAKDAFPSATVYGPAPVPELRLITCGGEFDTRTGHYRANVIVHAELVPGAEWSFSRSNR